MPKLSNTVFVVAILAAIIGAAGLTLKTSANYLQSQLRPPLVYTTTPDKRERIVCPGEILTYDFTLEVRETPTVLLVYKSLWSVAKGQNVAGASSAEVLAFTWIDKTEIDRSSDYEVPRTIGTGQNKQPLPPGAYRVNVGAVSEGRETVGFAVDFTVPENCPVL